MDGVRIAGVAKEKACPNPFRAVPSPLLIGAQKLFHAPCGFSGRVGALIFEKDGACYAHYATKPIRNLPPCYQDLTEELLWPLVTLDSIGDCSLFDALGREHSFRTFLTEHLNAYQAKDAFHGGKKLAWFKGMFLYAMKEALTSPAVLLLNAFNQERSEERLVSLGEWHIGKCEPHDVRFDGTFYPPLSSAKPLLRFLLEGHELVSCKEEPIKEIPLLYEDSDFIAVNKPARLASVPALGERHNALTELSKTFGPLYDVHRLDMATSGVILYAKNRRAQSAMHELFRSHRIHKHYVALLDGNVESTNGVIRLPLGVNRLDRPRQCVVPLSAGGKPAETQFEVLEKCVGLGGKNLTKIRLTPITGRTHQLRVHCAHKWGLNCCIFCDSFYGHLGQFCEAPEKRLYLHAEVLSFEHPFTRKAIEIKAPCDF